LDNEKQSVENEYLTFWLGNEYYGIDILIVQEIRTFEHVTTIANMPSHIKGVMNLRGVIIPIVDMRVKFNLSEITYNEMTVVIILNIGKRIVGIVVDSVADVVLLEVEDVQPPPNFASALDTQYITGLASHNELMLVLMDIQKLMNSDEMALFDQLSSSNEQKTDK
jgi:purine-binding chemotaxis protein CheW